LVCAPLLGAASGQEAETGPAEQALRKEVEAALDQESGRAFGCGEQPIYHVLLTALGTGGPETRVVVDPALAEVNSSRSFDLFEELLPTARAALDFVVSQAEGVDWVFWRGVIYVKPVGKAPPAQRPDPGEGAREQLAAKTTLYLRPDDELEQVVLTMKESLISVHFDDASAKRVQERRIQVLLSDVPRHLLLDHVFLPLGLEWHLVDGVIEVTVDAEAAAEAEAGAEESE
jgi:hypothetical protein